MNLDQLPAAVTAITAALPHWHHLEPEPTSRIQDHVWTMGGETVTLSCWESASIAHVQLAYEHGGSELSHLVLADVAQSAEWLRVVRLLPLATAVLQPDHASLPAEVGV